MRFRRIPSLFLLSGLALAALLLVHLTLSAASLRLDPPPAPDPTPVLPTPARQETPTRFPFQTDSIMKSTIRSS